MSRRVGAHALVAFLLLCCCFLSGFSQDPTDVYRGCYYDNAQRALTDLISCDEAPCQFSCGETQRYCESMNMMTISLCRDLCRSRNLRYYALEAGNQCFCGGAFSNPFQFGSAENQGNCSKPCTGDSSQTCGGEFQMQVYEFQGPLPPSQCFQPGIVDNAFISYKPNITVGDMINYICLPNHKITGDAQVRCQADGSWTPNMLPICNYTVDVSTIAPATTMSNSSTTQPTATPQPRTTIDDFLYYIIGASALLLLILVVCGIVICVCCKRKRSGNAGQDISLKPEQSQVTFINTGFHTGDDAEAKIEMPDILSATGGPSSPPPTNLYQPRMSTFSEEPVYQNGQGQLHSPTDPPSPIYLNAEAALPNTGSQPPSTDTPDGSNTGYIKRYSATTDRPYSKRASSSTEEPVTAYATGNRRGKKNGTGTKDLVRWSRPSSLYKRTEMDEDEDDSESNEDNTAVEPNALTSAIYAQIDKSRASGSRETLNSEVSGNSFFADPAKSSATRL